MNLRNLKLFLSNNSSLILTGMSVVGFVSTVVMASQATIKAQDILYDEGIDPRRDGMGETVKATWRCYIPTALMGLTTIGCIVGSHTCSVRQKEAIQSAYLISQTTLREYQKKVVEQIGKNKERAIREEVTQSIADNKCPVALFSEGVTNVIETGYGNTLFYDVPGERYFRSDINYLKSQVNNMNHDVRTEMYFDWNEISYRWKLPYKKFGSEHIFDIDRPLEVSFVPEMMENGQVRILVDYNLYPKGDWR